jgi:RNA polymerase sigma-70 factor (ECF subfamily)
MQRITNDMITQAAQGDLDAFKSIYQHSASFFYNVAFRIVNRKEDAEDIVQEVFMTIHRQLSNFRFDSSFKTWGYRITVNTALNYVKRASRNQHESIDVRGELNIPAQNQTVNEHQNDMVEKLLSVLNPEQKVCIILRSQQGLSYEEVSQTLNIPINTVRSRIKRAREAMMKFRDEVIKQ